MSSTPRVAIVGAGPAGHYTAEALLRAAPTLQVDLIEALPAPHGLVRYGVAPDHQKLKQVAAVFDGIARHERLRLWAGVCVGRDLAFDELQARCHAVVLASGCPLARRLGLPGEDLPQVIDSARFVGWYSGHPDQVALQPDLDIEDAVVIGGGNVALDVCRLLLRPLADLQASDIPQPMLERFARRGVRRVRLLVRGPLRGLKFSWKECRELLEMPGVRWQLPQAAGWDAGEWEGATGDDAPRVVQALREQAARPAAPGDLLIEAWFGAVPAAFEGDRRVERVRLDAASQSRGLPATLPAGLVVSCIGYGADPAGGLPAVAGHAQGQVLDAAGRPVDGLFVAGWAKRGPNGVIGTNRADGVETAQTLLARLEGLLARPLAPGPDLAALLAGRGVQPLSQADWQRLDAWERRRGAVLGKPREKALDRAAVDAALADPPAA